MSTPDLWTVEQLRAVRDQYRRRPAAEIGASIGKTDAQVRRAAALLDLTPVSHLYTANHCDVPVLSVSINSERKESVAIGDAARACVRAFWAREPFGTWKQSIIVARDDGALWSVVFDDEQMNAMQINDESLNGAEDFVSVPKRLIVHAYEFCKGGPDKGLVSELAKYAGVDSVSG